jgi:hypothetical protein
VFFDHTLPKFVTRTTSTNSNQPGRKFKIQFFDQKFFQNPSPQYPLFQGIYEKKD